MLISVKKEVATVAGIPQEKPNMSSDSHKNGVSCTPINGTVISAPLKTPSNGANISCQVATNLGSQKQLTQVFILLSSSLEICFRNCIYSFAKDDLCLFLTNFFVVWPSTTSCTTPHWKWNLIFDYDKWNTYDLER